MVSTETLKLLDALLAGSSGEEKSRLLSLYKEAFFSTESFKKLKDLIERSEFHGPAGQELLSKGEDVIKAGFTDAGSFGDRVTVMDYVVDKIQRELDAAAEYICSANVSGHAMNVVDRRLAEAATKYYERLFHYVSCLYASLYGESVLKSMKIKTGIRSTDLVRNINDELCNLIAEARRRPKPRTWRIVRRHFVGVNMVAYGGFVLEYGNVTPEYLLEKCEQVSALLFLDRNDPNVLCCGIGKITSLDATDGGRVYGAEVIARPALNCLDSYDIDYRSANIRVVLNTIAGNGVCIMDPEDLVEILNRYFMIKTARENRRKGCIYCGKSNCRHFRITKKLPTISDYS